MYFLLWLPLLFGFYYLEDVNCANGEAKTQFYKIEGKVFPSEELVNTSWQAQTRVFVDGGARFGYVREDGAYTVNYLPPESYLVEVLHPGYKYEPARVEINDEGKIRAKKVNYIDPDEDIEVKYPLEHKPLYKIQYFEKRQTWRDVNVTEFLLGPMFFMIMLPYGLALIVYRKRYVGVDQVEVREYGWLARQYRTIFLIIKNRYNRNRVPNPNARQAKKKPA